VVTTVTAAAAVRSREARLYFPERVDVGTVRAALDPSEPEMV
jgi:hypothetical protein